MRRFSCNAWDRLFNFVGHYEVTKVNNLVLDCMDSEKTKITIFGEVEISKNDFVELSEDEEKVYTGIVNDYTYDKTYTTITMLPLGSLLDYDVWVENLDDVNNSEITLETWMANRIKELYKGDDAYMNINHTRSIKSSTYGTIEEDSNGTYNLYDLSVDWLKSLGIMVIVYFQPERKLINFTITNTDVDQFYVIDTSEPDVIEYSMKTANANKPNKIFYINSEYYDDDTTEEERAKMDANVTYYWHPDGFSGTVSKSSAAPRLLPVKLKIKKKKAQEEKKDSDGNVTTEAKSFQKVCKEDAIDSMSRTSYDDEIELTVNSSSKVIPIYDLGTRYVIIVGDKRYYTMLTAKEELTAETMQLTFGMARTRLTQIVRQNWRITNDESD